MSLSHEGHQNVNCRRNKAPKRLSRGLVVSTDLYYDVTTVVGCIPLACHCTAEEKERLYLSSLSLARAIFA